MTSWDNSAHFPSHDPLGVVGYLRGIIKGVILGILVYGCLIVFAIIRVFEFPFRRRAVSPYVTQFVCRNAFRVLGIGYSVVGKPMDHPGGIVSNHVGWLDIFSLNAPQRVFFVSKSEVAGWFGIGILAKATGTVFIKRAASQAKKQKTQLHSRLSKGDKLLFFPEGTSSDSIRVLPFKSSLFAAFFEDNVRQNIWVQPVTLNYTPPVGADPRFYGWWGEMDFGSHLFWVLAARHHGSVEVVFHDPVRPDDFSSRKALAGYCEAQIRGAFTTAEP